MLQNFSKKRSNHKTIPSPIINGPKYIHTATDAKASVAAKDDDDDDDDGDDDDKEDIYTLY